MKTLGFATAMAVFAGSAFAQIGAINGVKIETYIPPFNVAIPSDLTTTNNYPALVQFDERNFALQGGFANKHQALFSTDGGTSAYALQNSDSFRLDFTVNVNTLRPDGQPRKEGGLVFYNPRPGFVDEGRVLVASDGEIAVFGGAMPFTGFGNAYVKGTTASLSFTYFAPGELGPKAAYRLTATTTLGNFDSGIKVWGDETDGTNGFNNGTNFGFLAQNQRLPVTAEFATTTYGGINIIPAPGAAALLGLAGLATARRRRA